MAIVIDPGAAQVRGTREILRDMHKTNETEIDQLIASIRGLLQDVSVEAPQGWRNELDDEVALLKQAVTERKDIKDALQALP